MVFKVKVLYSLYFTLHVLNGLPNNWGKIHNTGTPKPPCENSKLQENKQLLNNVLETIPRSSLSDCSASCLMTKSCLSINFFAPTLECQLNSKTRAQSPKDFVDKKRSFYKDRENRTSTLAGPCSNHDCESHEVCRVSRGTSQTTCASRETTGEKVMYNCNDVMMTYKYHGVYQIKVPQLEGDMKNVSVYCDMTTDGGGWLVFQRRVRGSDFNRTWDEYRKGFGDVQKEFWLGNEILHQITSNGSYELRIDFKSMFDNKDSEVYSSFSLDSEENNYTVHIGEYKGDEGELGLLLSKHNGFPFSTKDNYYRRECQDNSNCANDYGGAWWYNCDCNTDSYYSIYAGMLTFTEMKIRRTS